MSSGLIYRHITRIIPLNLPESTFEPASFGELIDGTVEDVDIRYVNDPQSGMECRIEMIMVSRKTRPGETIESINEAFDKKLKEIPGFELLKPGENPLNPCDKSLKVTVPKRLATNSTASSSNDGIFKISIVENPNFEKTSPKKAAVENHNEPELNKKIALVNSEHI